MVAMVAMATAVMATMMTIRKKEGRREFWQVWSSLWTRGNLSCCVWHDCANCLLCSDTVVASGVCSCSLLLPPVPPVKVTWPCLMPRVRRSSPLRSRWRFGSEWRTTRCRDVLFFVAATPPRHNTAAQCSSRNSAAVIARGQARSFPFGLCAPLTPSERLINARKY